MNLQVHTVLSGIAIPPQSIEQVRKSTEDDPKMQRLIKTIMDGWPETRKDCDTNVLEYFNHRDELSVSENLIFRGQRLVIPKALRQDILKLLHTGHLGVEKCSRLARDTVFGQE